MSLVTEPTPLRGLTSWTLETIDHRGDIYKMEFNPDGTLLATYGEDGAVRLWNSETGELARIFIGADSPSGGIAWSPDGAATAVASGTKIRAWQAATGKNVCTIALSDGEAAALAWSPDGKTFAVGQRPLDEPEAPARHLCLYDASSGKRTAERHRDDWNVEQIVWSPDSKRLLVTGDNSPVWLSESDDLAARAMPHPFPWNPSVAWTKGGAPLAAGVATVEKKQVVQLWEADPPRLVTTLEAASDDEQFSRVGLSPGGQFVLAQAKHKPWGWDVERSVAVWESESGKLAVRFDEPPIDGDLSRNEFHPCYAVSRNGVMFARCGRLRGGPAIFDAGARRVRFERRRTTDYWYGDWNQLLCAWAPDSQLLASRGEDGAIRYWNTIALWPSTAGAAPPLRSGYCNLPSSWDASSLAWLHGEPLALAVAYNVERCIEMQWASTGATAFSNLCVSGDVEKWAREGTAAPVVSNDGRLFAGIAPVRVFETAGARVIKTLDAIGDMPVTWSPDARQLAVRNGEATEIWDIEANECVRRFDGVSASLVWSPDGSRFVLSGGGDATIYDAESSNVLHSLDEPPVGPAKNWPRLAWSPDSRRIAGRGRIWEAETGEVIARLPRAALAGETGAPAWSPDCSTLAYLGPGRAVVVASVAPKVRHSTAQGETLGSVKPQYPVALKGRHSDDPHPVVGAAGDVDAAESRPVGADNSNLALTQGSAALHPGLSNQTPSGSQDVAPKVRHSIAQGETLGFVKTQNAVALKGRHSEGPVADGAGETPAPQVEAMLLTFNRGQVLSIAPSGHYRASPRADDLLAYVVQTADGQETLSREQFAERFGWKNNERWALAREDGPPGPSSNERDGLGRPPSNDDARGLSMSALALVQRPAALPGVESWTIAQRTPPGSGWADRPIDLSRDGIWLAQAGQDGVVRLIDMASGKVERLSVGHDGPLAAVAFSPDGKLLASLDSVGGNARTWDVASGHQVHSVFAGDGGGHDPGSLHWSPDGALLAICAFRHAVRLLDVARGEFLPRTVSQVATGAHGSFAWSPDGRRFACLCLDLQGIAIWDTSTLKRIVALEAQIDDSSGCTLAWSPDGSALVGYAGNGEIHVWNPATGKVQKKLKEEHGTWYTRVAWLRDSRRILISTGGPEGAQFWDLAAREPLGEPLTFERNSAVFGFSLSTDGKLLALAGGSHVGVFELASRTLVKEIAESPWAGSAAWSPNGRELAVTSNSNMAVWSTGTHRGVAMLPSGNLWGAQWLPSGDAIVNNDRVFQRQGAHWDVKPLAIEMPGSSADLYVLSPDGARLACLSPGADEQGKRRVCIWDVATAKRLMQTEPLAQYIHALAWSPDGARLAAGAENGVCAIFDSAGDKRLAQLPDVQQSVRRVAWSPDGHTLAAGYGDGVVRLCDASGKLVRELFCHRIPGYGAEEFAALHWSADGATLRVLDRHAVYVFDPATGERLSEAPRIDRMGVRPANFSPDGRYLAVATTCTRVWDLAELNEAAAIKAEGRRQKAENEEPKTQAPKPMSQDLNPKSKIQNPKLKLVASVVPLGHGQAVVVSADGHWLGTRGAEKEIVYVIKTAQGQETLAPREFYKRFGWKNDPSKVVLP